MNVYLFHAYTRPSAGHALKELSKIELLKIKRSRIGSVLILISIMLPLL